MFIDDVILYFRFLVAYLGLFEVHLLANESVYGCSIALTICGLPNQLPWEPSSIVVRVISETDMLIYRDKIIHSVSSGMHTKTLAKAFVVRCLATKF